MKKPFDKWGGLPIRRSDRVLSLTTLAEAAPVDNAMTLEKLLTAKRLIDETPDPYLGAFEVRCNERMLAEARLLGLPAVITNLVPDGHIVAVKRGQFGPEIAFIIAPEPKP